jgi:phospholipid/cholesterol/gamma-HCH transport system substrate-binding protein
MIRSGNRKRTALLVVAALIITGLLVWREMRSRQGTEFTALFDSAVALYPGSDVQILGVPVGTVTAVDPKGDAVRVSMRLDRGQEVSADTAAVIVAPTLVSDRFVQLTKPLDGGTALTDGAVLPKDRTAVPVEVDDLYRSLNDIGQKLGPNGANRNGALSDLLDVAASNLKGQGAGLNQMITEFGKATGTLSDIDKDFFATVANLKDFNDMLVANDTGVANVNRQFAAVTDYLAEDRQDLADAVANLGEALGVLDGFIKDNRGHLQASVDQLIGPTQVLVKQKDSLEEAVRLIPLALQNFLNAYNPATQTLDGRGNLNEVSLWSNNGLSAQTSKKAPPVLLPGIEDAP